ncbi:hypothetical protein, partial [Mariprofundus erugo]|uniref:hypothetical protein n=1 Tax=Mariprofundus erugo TaxID=2528639 RepID=UPI001EE8FCB1
IIGLASPESGFMYVCFQSLMRCINKHSLAVVDWGSHISPTDSWGSPENKHSVAAPLRAVTTLSFKTAL